MLKRTILPLVIAATTLIPSVAWAQMASYYSDYFQGRRTASGEVFNTWDYTAAHPNLPFGTRVQVTNLNNG